MEGLLVPVCVYMVLAMSLNLTVGILGELSLGHAGFMSVGAFSGVLVSRLLETSSMPQGIRFAISLTVGALIGGIFGILIGIPVLRLNGDYLAIVTLAFGEIIKAIMNNLYVGKDADGIHVNMTGLSFITNTRDKYINGPLGLTHTPQYSTFFAGVILVIITYIVCEHFIHSRDGRAVRAVRDNRIAAESVGIPVTKYKLLAFTLSSAMAGAAGCLYAHNYSTMLATKLDYNKSILILVLVVLGGIGNMKGSIISALILTVLPELLRSFDRYRMLIYSILLIAIMLINWSPKSRKFIDGIRARIRTCFSRKKTAVTK
jgi:branched-chain amino acid transport system permease protein